MYKDKNYCKFCSTEIDFNFKDTAVCPYCSRELTVHDVVPGWKVETNVARLKAMHSLMCETNAEGIYMTWATLGVPDCPSEEDFFDIAVDEEECKEMFDLFKELISKKGYW